jgi:hypothetical protein
MSTDLDVYLPFSAGAGSVPGEDSWRKYARLFQPSGIDFSYVNAFSCYGDSTGRQVKVKTGRAFIDGFYGENTSEKTISLAVGNGVNPRIDRIVLQLDQTSNKVTIEVVQGTAAASPSAPALTQSATGLFQFSLAQIALTASYTTVAAADVTDERQAIINGIFPACRINRTTNQTITDPSGILSFNAADTYDNEGMHDVAGAPTRITIVTNGIYSIGARCTWAVASAPDAIGRIGLSFLVNGASAFDGGGFGQSVVSKHRANSATELYLVAGNYVEVQAQYDDDNSSPATLAVELAEAWVSWVGQKKIV